MLRLDIFHFYNISEDDIYPRISGHKDYRKAIIKSLVAMVLMKSERGRQEEEKR